MNINASTSQIAGFGLKRARQEHAVETTTLFVHALLASAVLLAAATCIWLSVVQAI